MTKERAIQLALGTANPLPPETDPEWTEFAEFLEVQPELDAWFANLSPADAALADALQRLDPPTPQAATFLPTPVQAPMTRRRWLAAAACATLSAASAAWLLRPPAYRHAKRPASYAGFCEDMCIFAASMFRLDHKAPQFDALAQWLTQRATPAPGSYPAAVTQRMAKGCKTVSWGDRAVGLICFARADGALVHIFSIPETALAALPSAEEIRTLKSFGGRDVAGWSAKGTVSILVSGKPGTPIADLLLS